jgi:hypothetical protein
MHTAAGFATEKAAFVGEGAIPEGYHVVGHSVLKNWQYASTTPEGTPIMVKGDMLVHDEALPYVRAMLGKSKLREVPIAKTILKASG